MNTRDFINLQDNKKIEALNSPFGSEILKGIFSDIEQLLSAGNGCFEALEVVEVIENLYKAKDTIELFKESSTIGQVIATWKKVQFKW